MIKRLLTAVVALCSVNAFGYELTVLVGDEPRPEYHARGTIYIEAIRGENYSLRLTNPTPDRVAVALSVDGLNTIDARHTDAWNAAKWVLEPYESTMISGWQVNERTARRFFFTGERDSYGAAVGQTENLGVIEAVFFRERRRQITVYAPRSKAQAPAAPEAQGAVREADEYAATGMGERTGHEVERVQIDLDPRPIASIRIRYEFRPQLIKLGVLMRDPLQRRERAKGFERYCPEPR
jgi:hypothetical protein